jgi:hypothetical protein
MAKVLVYDGELTSQDVTRPQIDLFLGCVQGVVLRRVEQPQPGDRFIESVELLRNLAQQRLFSVAIGTLSSEVIMATACANAIEAIHQSLAGRQAIGPTGDLRAYPRNLNILVGKPLTPKNQIQPIANLSAWLTMGYLQARLFTSDQYAIMFFERTNSDEVKQYTMILVYPSGQCYVYNDIIYTFDVPEPEAPFDHNALTLRRADGSRKSTLFQLTQVINNDSIASLPKQATITPDAKIDIQTLCNDFKLRPLTTAEQRVYWRLHHPRFGILHSSHIYQKLPVINWPKEQLTWVTDVHTAYRYLK